MRKKKNTVMKLQNAFNGLLSGLNPDKENKSKLTCIDVNKLTKQKYELKER